MMLFLFHTDSIIHFIDSEFLIQDGVVKVDKALEKKLKKEQKRLMKEAKKARKEEKLRKRKLKEEQLELEKKVEDDESWKKQKKLIDLGPVKEEEIYGGNEHFNFGKPKKEVPPLPSHNPRPDFEKADWRDIEMWKAVREKEKQEKGEKETNWKEEEHYLPSRINLKLLRFLQMNSKISQKRLPESKKKTFTYKEW
ncbi:unnamed protein product [Brugia pahangi]|uniref:Cir_N domain-containing protein n=1 Tax=Brugia pahangi TaxID=6280 RepID=A0A0N4TCK9_BRUPA|nr:unnamed protein product [Brugia pahangi]